MPLMLQLSTERGEQLRAIAAAKNTTIPELIADYVRQEIAAGVIPAGVPGVDVKRVANTIVISTEAGFEAELPQKEAAGAAEVLRGAATIGNDPERKMRWMLGLAALSGIKARRTGRNSIALVSPLTGAMHSLSLNLAADLADQIEAV